VKSTQVYFVQKLLRAILMEWPEWRLCLQTPPHLLPIGFWFIVPAPNKDVTRGLSISIDQRMVIVGFDDDHDHLWQRKKEHLAQFRMRVLARIHDLMDDKIFAISWRDKEGNFRTSNCFVPESKSSNQFVQQGYSKRVRSWSDKYDQDIKTP